VLLEEGYTVTGADLHISSTVPQGAGLSSSAALETASALALLDGRIPDRVTMARWCQRAENGFVGARCGIMDQYVACLGQAGHALMIDCRSLVSRAVPVPPQATVVVANTMVKHSIAGPEYAERRRQCEEIVNVLTAVLPHILSLRDVTLSDLETHGHLLSSRARKRARHVISENARVLEAAHALECGHLDRLGELMCDSHGSLRDDFEVSSPELDLMVTLALAQPGVFGSRMTGGGFGGSTVTLVAASAASMLMDALRTGYERETGTTPDVRVCTPSAGASDVMGEHARA
jgi:galactokinase